MIQLKSILSEASLAFDNDFKEMVKQWEGPGPTDANGNHLAYDDANPKVPAKPGDPIIGTLTIGYGTTAAVFPTLKAGMKISKADAEKLLAKGIADNEAKANRLIPKFNSYPKYVRTAILNAIYRGDLGPATRKLINQGKWNKVAGEYLNHPNYLNPGRFKGVVKRMKSNSDAFKQYASELQTSKPTTAKAPSTKSIMIGKTLYPKPGTGYVNVRDEDYVNNGIINNLSTTIKYPNPVGVVIRVQKGQDGKMWYYVKLEDGSNGYVRSDVVKTTKSSTYTVKPGDRLLDIAMKNGLTLDSIMSLNALRNSNVTPGQTIRLI
jgi:GH24 family phage-related lysozyme (muramidase)/LysM repeat protein